jgi:hypothetical protein
MLTKRGGYRGKPKPKLPPHLKRVPVNARIQQWMIDQLKEKGEVGIILEEILINAGFKYREPEVEESEYAKQKAGSDCYT